MSCEKKNVMKLHDRWTWIKFETDENFWVFAYIDKYLY